MKLDPSSGSSIFGYNIEGLAPAGQVIAVCLDIRDQFGVDRKKFQSEEIEKQDVTRFLFGYIGQDQQPHLVQTFEFKISGNSGSNLVEFLKAWTNRDPYGFDYLELKGTGAMLTVGQKQSTKTPGKYYNTIGAVSPVYPTLQAQIPHPSVFAALLTKALTQPDMGAKSGPSGHAAPPPAAPPAPPAPAPLPPPPAPSQGLKFWVVNTATGSPALVPGDSIIIKGDANLLIMREDQVGGWVPASTLLNFTNMRPPTPPSPAPSMPVAPPPPPPVANPAWQQPATPPPPVASANQGPTDDIPF